MEELEFNEFTGAIKPKIKTVWDNGMSNMESPVLESGVTFEGAGEAMSPSFAKSKGMDGLADTKSAGGFDFGNMFKVENIGGTLQGIGAIAGAAAGIYDAHNKKKYQDKVFAMEEKRVARETERQDKQQANYDKVFG
jgi:hypothetical protein